MLNTFIADLAEKKGRLVVAAIAGMVLLVVFMSMVAPMVLGHPMDPPAMVNKMLGLPEGSPVGTAAHFLLGLVIFPLGYMLFPYRYFPGPPVVRGFLYGAILATIAGAIVFPLAGEPMFLGSPKGAMALYMVHLLYAGLIGLIVGPPSPVALEARLRTQG